MYNNFEIIKFFEDNSEQIDKLLVNYNEIENILAQEFRKNIDIEEIQTLKKDSDFNITYRNLVGSYGVYRDDIIYKGYSFNIQFVFSPTKGVTDLYIWSNGEREKKIIQQLNFGIIQHFKPSQMLNAGKTVNNMIKTMLEYLDNQ